MKKTLTQTGPTFWPQKAQIRDSLNSILVKKDRNYIIINCVTLRLTKEKLLKMISFLPFLTQIGQKSVQHPLNLAFLAIIAIYFHAGGFTTTTFCFKRHFPSKI